MKLLTHFSSIDINLVVGDILAAYYTGYIAAAMSNKVFLDVLQIAFSTMYKSIHVYM